MRGTLLGSLAVATVLATALTAAQRDPVSFQLTWVDRQGAKTPIGRLPPGTFAPRVSPDGRSVAFDTGDGSIWIADLANLASPRRVATGRFPMWSPDGTRLVFAGVYGFQLYWQAADGSGEAERIADQPARAPESWSTALGLVSYITLTGTSDYDVWAFSPGDRSQRPLIAEPTSAQMSSRFSPDGRWLAYQSNETGRYEVYVEPFPRSGVRVRISDAGGERPVWSPDAREIFFDRDATLYTASVTTVPALAAPTPVALPISGFEQGAGRRMWDISPDGARFLLMFR
jgi:dipeptidyl aminopeptidase/acylaminoacyl peptidase